MINTNLYPDLLTSIVSIIEKDQHAERIHVRVQPEESKENVNQGYQSLVAGYEALCILELHEPYGTALENADFTRGDKKKKNIKCPDFSFDTTPKLYQSTEEHKVIIYDKKAEFIMRNKVFESCLRVFNSKYNLEFDSRTVFKQLNDLYEEVVDITPISSLIQTFTYVMQNEASDS